MTSFETDYIRLMELLASKVCHDIISPVGAISNGVEILEEMGLEDAQDVIELISFSATQANAKLKVMRLAYGLGGSDESIKAEDVHKIFSDYISGDERLSQDWDPHADLGITPCAGLAKSIMCSLLFIIDALPRGGVISVTGEDKSMKISAKGENVGFKTGFIDALNGESDINDLDPKLVHSYATGLILKHYGFTLAVETSKNDFISLRLNSSNVF